MVDKKISALTELAETPAADDVVAIVDTSLTETKKITPANLLGSVDYDLVSGNDAATDVTGAQLETMSDGSNADALHTHSTFTGNMIFTPVDVAMVNGANNNVAFGTGTIFEPTGLTGTYNITGIAGGIDGRFIIFSNTVGFNCTFVKESASSDAANRIETGAAGNIIITGQGVIQLYYSAFDSRWRISSQRL